MERDSVYEDPRHYDLLAQMTAPDDHPFYQRMAEKHGGPALVLACGTGRVCLPLAAGDFEVSGLDVSGPMILRAMHNAHLAGAEIEFIRADCRYFKLDRKFSLILFPYNSINHLIDFQSIRACFTAVGEHLAEGGRFIIDTFNPDLKFLEKDTSGPLHVITYLDPDGKGKVVMTETSEYDCAAQVNRIVWHYEIDGQEDAVVHRMDMRIFFPQELDALLKFNGFEIEHKHGNYNESPFGPDSPHQIVVSTVP
jgi:SAM-dependent methyltransferase